MIRQILSAALNAENHLGVLDGYVKSPTTRFEHQMNSGACGDAAPANVATKEEDGGKIG